MPSKEDKLGALWVKSSERGDYFTGEINGQKIVVFANSYKNADKQPDWIIYKSKPKPEAR
jgi:hypothetical protein